MRGVSVNCVWVDSTAAVRQQCCSWICWGLAVSRSRTFQQEGIVETTSGKWKCGLNSAFSYSQASQTEGCWSFPWQGQQEYFMDFWLCFMADIEEWKRQRRMTCSSQELSALQSHDTRPKPLDCRDVPQTPFVIKPHFIPFIWKDLLLDWDGDSLITQIHSSLIVPCSGHRP